MNFFDIEEQKKPAEQRLWRYLDLSKFLSLIDSQNLFLCRADLFLDQFEGSLTQGNLKNRKEKYGHSHRYRELDKGSTFLFRNLRRFTYLSCWHINETESAAMWHIYLKSGEGVAVTTTTTKIWEQTHSKIEAVYGEVKYINYQTAAVEAKRSISPFFYKRKSFEHEAEFRVATQVFPKKDGMIDLESIDHATGIPVPIDPNELIDEVIISPTAPEWFTTLVKSISKKYSLLPNVKKSELLDEPKY